MGDFLKSLSSFLTFLQQHVFPSFVFVTLNEFVILPTLLSALSQWGIGIGSLPSDLLTRLGLAFIVAVVLGYVFESFNTPLIEFFQGFHMAHRFYGRWLTRGERRRRDRLKQRIDNREFRASKQADHLKELASRYEVGSPKREELYRRRRELESETREEIAHHQKQLREQFSVGHEPMPTRLGNVMASSYDYASQRYSIDAVALWPRILPLLARKGYTAIVEREKAKVDFFLDSCVLAAVLSVECLLVVLSGADPWFLVAALVMLVATYGLYRLAVVGAFNWGRTIRSAFDLYRYDLLSDLYGQSPEEFGTERALWARLSQFIREGRTTMSDVLDYQRIQETVGESSKVLSETIRGEDRSCAFLNRFRSHSWLHLAVFALPLLVACLGYLGAKWRKKRIQSG